MGGVVLVLLPPTTAHVAPLVLEAGAIPLIDATGSGVPEVAQGAWVRTRPGRPAPGTGPVVLAELGAPVPDRETWLETAAPRGVPPGFAGLLLKGREAGGFAGEADGLSLLEQCPHPERVILDAGLGPATAGCVPALGGAGLLVAEQHLGCPEIELPAALDRRLALSDDEVTCLVAGLRVCNSPTAPVLRKVLAGEDPWALADGVWERGDPRDQLWMVGQGIALARGLAQRHGTLGGLIAAYREGWEQWSRRVREAIPAPGGRPVSTAGALLTPGTVASSGGVVGSGVLWQEAAWIGRSVHGEPLRAAAATGCPVCVTVEELGRAVGESTSSGDSVSTGASFDDSDSTETFGDSESTTPAAEDSESTPAFTEDSEPPETSAEDSEPPEISAEDFESPPAFAEDSESTPAPAEDSKSTPARAEDSESTPASVEDSESTPASAEDSESTPASAGDPKALGPEELPVERIMGPSALDPVEPSLLVGRATAASPPTVDDRPGAAPGATDAGVPEALLPMVQDLVSAALDVARHCADVDRPSVVCTGIGGGSPRPEVTYDPHLFGERLFPGLFPPTRESFAAALEALGDAGIPLVHATGSAASWMLPEPLRDDTGLVFASTLPGRRTLAGAPAQPSLPSRGYAWFARFLGLRGPCTAVDSFETPTLAVAVAEDWIRSERCRRVIVVGAADETSGQIGRWLGGREPVTGALAAVLERQQDGQRRGVGPVAQLFDDGAWRRGDEERVVEREALASWCAEVVGSDRVVSPAEGRALRERRLSGTSAVDTAPLPATRSRATPVPVPREVAPPLPGSATLPPSFRIRRPVLVDRGATLPTSLHGRCVLVVGSSPAAQAIRAEVVERSGSLEGPHDAVVDVGDDVMESFEVARKLDRDRPHWWLTLTRLGDLDQVYPADHALTDGARAGFTKALAREWEGCRVKVLDLGLEVDDQELARAVCGELVLDMGAIEVFGHGRERRTIEYEVVPPPPRHEVPDGQVVVITGGGRGVCARIALEFARRGPVDLVLVGRGPMGHEPADLQREKDRIIGALRATNARVTTAEVERRIEPLLRAEEVRRNVVQMESLGARVEYLRADLSSAAAVESLLREVRSTFGEPAVVIHGAGEEQRRLLADKDSADFHRVFDGKALGGLALVQALPPGVPLVSMGSVTGRFGSTGHVDYAAANEAMARACRARPGALHVAWTAWDDVGMSMRDGVRAALEKSGVDLLPSDAGASLLVDLIGAGAAGELVVAGKLGGFYSPPAHPLLDRLEMDGDVVRVYRRMSVQSEGWNRDHTIDGTPLLPGVIALELMAAAASSARPGVPVAGFREVVFHEPLRLQWVDPVLLIVEAVPVAETEVHCRLLSERTEEGPVQRTEHVTATATFGGAVELRGLPSAFFPPEEVGADAIYRRFFQGPTFQVITGAVGVAADGLLGEAIAEPAGIAEHLLTEPLVLDAAFQGASLHHMIVDAALSLPVGVDEVCLLHPCPPGVPFTVMVQRTTDRYDVDVDGPAGPVMRVRGLALLDYDLLAPQERFEEPPGGRPLCLASAAPRVVRRALATARYGEDVSGWLDGPELSILAAAGGDDALGAIAGHLAGKRAVVELTGASPAEVRLEYQQGDSRRVVVTTHAGIQLALAQRGLLAVALAGEGGRIGVCVQPVESVDPTALQGEFGGEELAGLGDQSLVVAVGRGAKGAVLDALGSKLGCSPRDVVVEAVGSHTVSVVLRGDAAAAHSDLGRGTLELEWAEWEDDLVVVTASLVVE